MCALLVSSRPAFAAAVTLRPNGPREVGRSIEFAAAATGTGAISYTWDFGDGTRFGPTASGRTEHTYAAPGHYPVVVIARDDSGIRSESFVQTVHFPLTAQAPRASSSIIYDGARNRVCTANPDHDSVTCLDGTTLERRFETRVGRRPRTLSVLSDGTLWVANEESASLTAVGESGSVIAAVPLPYGSRPFGVAPSATGDVLYVTLGALGQLATVDAAARVVLRTLDVGPTPAGIAVIADGKGDRVYVTRFSSPVDHGELVELGGAPLEKTRTFELAADPGPDTEATGRGVPNYLRSVVVSPDGRSARVPSKKDNTVRGAARDGNPLTFESTVRTIVSTVDLIAGAESLESRVDLNNRSMGLAAAMSPLGDYVFVALLGSGGVEVLDAYSGAIVASALELCVAPDGLAFGAGGRLYVHCFLSRSVFLLDASKILDAADARLPILSSAPTVTVETLAPRVLAGKRLFYDAADPRMSQDGYVSCAACHLDGFEDGRVWDFTDRGEGFRNTISLLGRRGTGQGPLHWTANFDEVQDFEHDIRNAFGGSGFLPDASLDGPLGERKAGRGAELDALAAYLESLSEVPVSPHRDPDGSLTEDGWIGRALFRDSGCPACHWGSDFTDSAAGVRHDVGTLSATSGKRLGEDLDGLDTPTLRGIWQTAPYLHDGSASSLADVVGARNPDDRHGRTTRLTPRERAQLVAYLLQIDNVALEDERESPSPSPADASMDAADAEVDVRHDADAGLPRARPDARLDAGTEAASSGGPPDGGCGCRSARRMPAAGGRVLLLMAIGLYARRRSGAGRAMTSEPFQSAALAPAVQFAMPQVVDDAFHGIPQVPPIRRERQSKTLGRGFLRR